MNKNILAAALFTAVTILPTAAEAAVEEYEYEMCLNIQEFATAAMGARQNGVSMSDLMQVARDSDDTFGIMASVVTDAFGVPAYSTPEYRQKAVREFSDTVFRECYVTMNEE